MSYKNLFILLCFIFTISPVMAKPPEPPPEPPPGGGTCDFTELKNSIAGTESGGDCSQEGLGDAAKVGANGKYQFIPDTWKSMVKNCPNAERCPHASHAFFHDPVCCQVQECAMDNLLAANLKYTKSKACQELLGKSIEGLQIVYDRKKKTWVTNKLPCQVSLSGILGAAHLGGNDVCSNVLNGRCGGNGDFDGAGGGCTYKGTSEAYYMCRHGNKGVPGQCTPPAGHDAQTPPIGTWPQIRIRIGQGEPVIIGSNDGIKEHWVAGMMLMAEQFTANMAMMVQMIGTLFDAKHQLETQRLFQEKVAEAHKDYQPSEQMCTFGTMARDLLATERSANLSRTAVSAQLLQRELGSGDSMGMSYATDSLSRLAQFRKKFCNPDDNGKGLKFLCPTAAPAETRNVDINYTQVLDQPLSLDINLMKADVTPDEEIVFALVDNLFAHDPMPRLPVDPMAQQKYQYHYMNVRSIVAMRGIARNSISNIIAMKTATPNAEANGASAAPYMRALMLEFGLKPEEVKKLLGDNPSYYAQMELLTKKIYQNPSFYTNLYDKPANIERIRTAMRAIKLMQDRDIQASLHRREMLLSIMLELRLRQRAEAVYNAAETSMFDAQ